MLAPFAKNGIQIRLTGATSFPNDVSVDITRLVSAPLIGRILSMDDHPKVSVEKRGVGEGASKGQVLVTCLNVKKVAPIKMMNEGRVKRIRGVASSTGMSSVFMARSVDKARNLLNRFLPDVWIYTEKPKNSSNKQEPYLSVCLVSETFDGVTKGADVTYDCQRGCTIDAESLGREVASRLLLEISAGGVVDTMHQHYILLMMALSEDHKLTFCRLGKLSQHAIQMIRHIKDFFGVTFKFEDVRGEEDDAPIIEVSCVGINLSNVARKTF
eukprot:GHVL01045109.1.p1 GENE.GHVL01045109.1~~GHVL01045109.1.p1  ORF type:complete len:270 (+),score=36.48 GHVL01045109.1:430-1239(+)